MNGQSVAPLRYIVTPTLKDISDQDREEFEAAEAQPVMAELSAENDQVSGTEKYYNYILHSQALVSAELGSVTGAEGLLGSLKRGAGRIIQIVKDFFKWIWSFFSAKEKKIDHKLQYVDSRLRDKGVKAGEVYYPQATYYIYPKTGPGKPAGDLGWVSETNKRIAKGITNANSYATLLTEHLNLLEKMAKDRKPVSEMVAATTAYSGKVRALFGAPTNKDKATFITQDDFRFGATKIAYHPTSNRRTDFHISTFTTTVTTVEEIRKDTAANLALVKKMTVDLHKLEKEMVDTLTFLKNSKDLGNGVHKVFASIINNSLDDIRTFENVLYRALNTIGDLCKAAVN
jgi:hypothetical protein